MDRLVGDIEEYPYGTQAGAILSGDRKYRYLLWRSWDPVAGMLNVVGLNPSTADETEDDPTIRRCLGLAHRMGHGGLYMTNLFSWRSTEPAGLLASPEPIGPDNDIWIIATAKAAADCVVAWGGTVADKREYRRLAGRGSHVTLLLQRHGVQLLCLRKTGKGFPAHPLYLPNNLRPIPYP